MLPGRLANARAFSLTRSPPPDPAHKIQREEESSHRGDSPQPSSPTNSAVSDSGHATDRGGQEADSRHVGYTSDQSDIVKKAPVKAHRRSDPMPASAPVHTSSRYSLLSSERIKFSNQSGLLTLAFIILAATNFRLILENSLKYGFRFNPITFVRYALTPSGNFKLLLCWPALAVFIVLAYWIERLGVELLAWDKKVRGGLRGSYEGRRCCCRSGCTGCSSRCCRRCSASFSMAAGASGGGWGRLNSEPKLRRGAGRRRLPRPRRRACPRASWRSDGRRRRGSPRPSCSG